jgi:hypothetical protein
MNIYKFEINGKKYIIINDWRKTRNGFAHDSQIMNESNGYFYNKSSAFYLNRTWESYEYRTAMLKLIEKSGFNQLEIKEITAQLDSQGK